MISEKDKQAILNGAYGITVEGKKVKYIGKRDLAEGEPAFPYFFVILSENGKISIGSYLSEDLTYALGDGNAHEIVGLWEDKPEPFNLERALLGEPVMTRDRSKAYVQAIISQPKELEHYNLIGFGYNGEHKEFLHWDKTGKVTADDITCDDIIGMWKDPEPVSNNITVTLPRALKEPQDEMWFVDSEGYMKSGYGKRVSTEAFNRRFFFGSEADAKAWFDAMQNSRQ